MTEEEQVKLTMFSLKVRGFEVRNMVNGLFDGFFYFELREEIKKEEEEIQNEYEYIENIVFNMKKTHKPNTELYLEKSTIKARLESIERYNTYRAFFTYIKCKCPICSQREQPVVGNPFSDTFHEDIKKSPVPIFYKFGWGYSERQNSIELHEHAIDNGWKAVKNKKGEVIWIAPNP